MSRTITHGGRPWPERARAGLTFTEMLFAAGILAIGVLGIMSLVPVAMRQVADTSANTLGPLIAKNALISLQHGQLDMADYDAADYTALADSVLFNTGYRRGRTGLNIGADTPLVGYSGWSEAIYQYHVDGTAVGNDSPSPPGDNPTFQIPGGMDYLHTDTWQDLFGRPDRPPFIPVAWASAHGWTAVFLPISAGGDLITPFTTYRVQIAVWRQPKWRKNARKLLLYAGTRDGAFIDGDAGVVLSGGDIARADVGDYIRLDDYGVWYRINGIEHDTSQPEVTLATPFQHPSGGPLPTGSVSIASSFKLIGLYEGQIGPDE